MSKTKSKHPLNVPMLRFPRLYIVALVDLAQDPGTSTRPQPAMFHLESAPASAFDVWVSDLAKTENVDLTNDLNGIDRATWSTTEKWWIVNVLAERNVDMTKYLFESREAAARALKLMSEVKVEVGGKA